MPFETLSGRLSKSRLCTIFSEHILEEEREIFDFLFEVHIE